MKCNPFRLLICSMLLTTGVVAQKTTKTFKEDFKTNKDVAIEIDASHAEIAVTTWNKNQVAVEATITVEGIDKKEAERYIKQWDFEALGNKSKVSIEAHSGNSWSTGEHGVTFYNMNDMGELSSSNMIVINEDFDQDFVVIPEIEIPEIEFDEIAIPDLEDLDFDFDKYEHDGDSYFFTWKDGVNNISIKSKKEWEEFKKTKEYKKFKKEHEKRLLELKKQKRAIAKSRAKHRKALLEHKKALAVHRKKHQLAHKKAMLEARVAMKKLNKEKIEKALAKAQKSLKNTNISFSFVGPNEFTVNGKKVKITKKITVKVPKNATFDLNTRHCKVKLPKTKANGKVSYGTLKAKAIDGGKLDVSFAPVSIESLNACSLFLNNVTDAKIASVTNAQINGRSSRIEVLNLADNVALFNDFGELNVLKIQPTATDVVIGLKFGEATIAITGLQKEIEYSSTQPIQHYSSPSSIKFSLGSGASKKVNGSFKIQTADKSIEIQGKLTQLTLR
ncbi:conserved exported hypothetical protein [Tenacibaculum litopenaei]|uniref:hypothetical protein n=1 Tax=Tenacibaculum litopenaei TaxID=396016 RepID=UPI0038957719